MGSVILSAFAVVFLSGNSLLSSGSNQRGTISPKPFSEKQYKLSTAVFNADVAGVKKALADGADPNGDWPLLDLNGNPDEQLAIAKLLVAAGGKAGYVDPIYGYTAVTGLLQRMQYQGEGRDPVQVVRYLISKGARVDIPLSDGTTALHLAAHEAMPGVVRELLIHHADPNARTYVDTAPRSIHYKMRKEANAAFEQLTNDKAFEPGYKPLGITPLLSAFDRNWNPQVAKLLVDAGANPKATDMYGWSIIHRAAKMLEVDAISFSLKHGLNVNARTKGGVTPLYAALKANGIYQDVAVIKQLFDKGANPNQPTALGVTPQQMFTSLARSELNEASKDPGFLLTSDKGKVLRNLNTVAKLLDVNATPFSWPDKNITRYGVQLKELDFGAVVADRYVKTENGHVVLTLSMRLSGDVKGDQVVLTLNELLLHGYEPLKELPKEFVVKKGELTTAVITFPIESGTGGGIYADYGCSSDAGSGSGFINEDEPGYLRFSIVQRKESRSISIMNASNKQSALVRIVSLNVDGPIEIPSSIKTKVFSIPPGKQVTVPGLSVPGKSKRMAVDCEERFLPNKRWRKTSYSYTDD